MCVCVCVCEYEYVHVHMHNYYVVVFEKRVNFRAFPQFQLQNVHILETIDTTCTCSI